MNARFLAVSAILLVAAVALTVWQPYWPMLILLWWGCPGFNALGGCGFMTGHQIAVRFGVGLLALAVIYFTTRWVRKGKS